MSRSTEMYVSKVEGAAAGARQIPGIPQPLLYSEPVSMHRSFETVSVCSETDRVQTGEAPRDHIRADTVEGRAFDGMSRVSRLSIRPRLKVKLVTTFNFPVNQRFESDYDVALDSSCNLI